MARRSPRAGVMLALWLLAATAALVLGLVAVTTIGTGITGGSTAPLSAAQIDAELARPAAPAPPRAAPGPAAGAPSVVPAGPAGTVVVRCTGATPSVVSVNPAQGFEASGSDDGGSTVKLEGDDVEVAVALRCDGGRPAGTVTVDADD